MIEQTQPGRLVFVDVDTQVDFMLPGGKLYVPHAEEIIPNLRELMLWARAHKVPIVSTSDTHAPDDPEFAQWPPHCVAGTPGQRRIPETLFPDAVVVENRPGAFYLPSGWDGQIVVEKQVYDFTTNVNIEAILASLGQPRLVVFGVATEYCVRSDVLALRSRDLPVALVVDAIKSISAEGGRKAIEEMVAAGANLVTTAEVCRPMLGAEQNCLRLTNKPKSIYKLAELSRKQFEARPEVMPMENQAKSVGNAKVIVALRDLGSVEGLMTLAVQLCNGMGAELVALHVVEVPPVTPLEAADEILDHPGKEILAAAARVAERFSQKLCTELLRAREVGETIVAEAKDLGAELLIVGHRGAHHTVLAELLLGSTAQYVARHAPCRVIIQVPAPQPR
jgi:nicotinamidase/pyrazinamidase